VFVELGGLCDIADGKDNILGRCPAGIEARANVFADLLDLRPQIALMSAVPQRA
jgi:hypothetical protein